MLTSKDLIGKRVKVIFTRNDVFDWQISPSFDAICYYVPAASGDCWQFDVGGAEIIINPQSSDFVGIEVVADADR